jgi:hypothetical protein
MKVLSFPLFKSNGRGYSLDTDDVEKMYCSVREDLPPIVVLQGSRVYGNPKKRSDLDVMEIYDSGKRGYENIKYRGIELSILKASKEEIDEDIESGKHGNYLTARLCRLNKFLVEEEEDLGMEKRAMDKFLNDGMRRTNAEFITPSYGMKMINIIRMWYEPQRWWSIYNSFIDCPWKERNIGVYYEKVERVMDENAHLGEVGSHEGEKAYEIEGVERRKPPIIRGRVSAIYNFAKAQISASDLMHVLRELYPKLYGFNMSFLYEIGRYKGIFTF